MYYIDIYNFETGKTTVHSFTCLLDAEDFASDYVANDNEEISISNGIIGMEWSDYLCWGQCW